MINWKRKKKERKKRKEKNYLELTAHAPESAVYTEWLTIGKNEQVDSLHVPAINCIGWSSRFIFLQLGVKK